MLGTLSFTTACGSSNELGEENVGTVQQAAEFTNGLAWNGIGSNGIGSNGIGSNGIGSNGIGSNGLQATSLASNSVVMSALTDPYAQQLLQYVTSCALDDSQSFSLTINSTPVPFAGHLGLATGWGLSNGTCDSSCVAWVSACVMSRLNYLGEHVPLSFRGNAILASTPDERLAYPYREGAYYGDLFASTQKRYACTEHGSTLIQRPCGPDISTCILKVVGDCQDFCDAPDATEGRFSNCRDDLGNVYPGTITIFRQNSQ